MSKAIIKIEDLKREFTMGTETVHALRGISFTIKEGEFVTIMGSSGSGKSTLLNILGCLDQPSSGIYEIDGLQVKDLSRNELATIRNEKIGFIFQSYNLLAKTSAIENVELPLLYNSKVSTAERRERAIKALEMVGLADRLHHTPPRVSAPALIVIILDPIAEIVIIDGTKQTSIWLVDSFVVHLCRCFG